MDDPATFVDNLRRFYLLYLKERGLMPALSATRSMAKADRCVIVSVEWGYELHDCPMAMRTWRRIVKGAFVRRVAPYVYEGQRLTGEWLFNRDGLGTLIVGYSDGAIGFQGSLSKAIITIGSETIEWDEVVPKGS